MDEKSAEKKESLVTPIKRDVRWWSRLMGSGLTLLGLVLLFIVAVTVWFILRRCRRMIQGVEQALIKVLDWTCGLIPDKAGNLKLR